MAEMRPGRWPPQTSPRAPAFEKLPLMAALLIVQTSGMMMLLAVPDVMRNWDVPVSTAQWFLTAFNLAYVVAIPTTGFLLQALAARRSFALAMGLFILGTIVSAMAPSFPVLLGGRVLQGAGSALLTPLLVARTMAISAPHNRGLTIGVLWLAASTAPIVGPPLAGIILDSLDWRWLFWVALAPAIVATIAGIGAIQPGSPERPAPVEWLSIALGSGGLLVFVYGLGAISPNDAGGAPSWAPVPIVAGIVLLVLFAHRQRVLGRAALLDLGIFESRTFSATAVLTGLTTLATVGAILLLPIYLRSVLGIGAALSGLLLVPGAVVAGLASPLAGWLFDRLGARALVLPGTLITVIALVGLSTVGLETAVALPVAAHIALNFALAFFFTALTTSGLNSLPKALYGHGSTALAMVQRVAFSVGVTLFTLVMSFWTAGVPPTADSTALAAGMRAAFLLSAIIAIATVPVAWLLRDRPASDVVS